MIKQINVVLGHVKKVLAGEAPQDKELGRQLMDVVQAIPNLDSDTITNMLNSHMQVDVLNSSEFLKISETCQLIFLVYFQDLLAVEYLTYLTRQQLAISARINQIL